MYYVATPNFDCLKLEPNSRGLNTNYWMVISSILFDKQYFIGNPKNNRSNLNLWHTSKITSIFIRSTLIAPEKSSRSTFAQYRKIQSEYFIRWKAKFKDLTEIYITTPLLYLPFLQKCCSVTRSGVILWQIFTLSV